MIKLGCDVARTGFSMHVDLALPGRGVTALFGHSGSGKTTILRAVAGLERHANGYLEVNGALWQDDARGLFVPTHQRALGYVFQEASLFTHLSVRGNLDFVLKRTTNKGTALFDHVLALLGIEHLLERATPDLSGGERQRVAIARALLTQPTILLMDEPLAALDARRKEEVLPYLERIHAELDIPMLYVSHAAEEVARLADHVVLLGNGKVLASGPAADTLARLDLADGLAIDAGVLVEGVVHGIDAAYGLVHLQAAGATWYVAHAALALGTQLRLRVLARDVSLALARPEDSSVLNLVQAKVVATWPANTPAHVIVKLDAAGTALLARITRRSYDQLHLEIGKPVWAQVKAVALLSIKPGP
ncbi:molybdenum ABC transporter ATP-binding protein [Massilia sp. S19_KUP03_FR1]|uniref:molybdenum ABC transporter ATP-binding protein n=1 Tax=Massilia sp. S19_KUP03_FR1 TaxID=3025503 RepID=UPI002FCD236A